MIKVRRFITKQLALVQDWQARGLPILFTNGCFDIFHAGHAGFLLWLRHSFPKHKIVVGINTDASVSKLKGPTRPVHTLFDRIAVLENLRSVDMVVPFEEDTPLNLITRLKPAVLAKSAEYKDKAVVGASLVKTYGGTVVFGPYGGGLSTSEAIEKSSMRLWLINEVLTKMKFWPAPTAMKVVTQLAEHGSKKIKLDSWTLPHMLEKFPQDHPIWQYIDTEAKEA